MRSALHFRAQEALPDGVTAVDSHTLSPAQLDLLQINGTLTKFVEELIGDAIEVDVVGQRARPAGQHVARWLGGDAATRVTERRIVALARRTSAPQFCAQSSLLFELLPSDFVDRLRESPGGLGAALDASAIETTRELLWWGRARTPAWATARGLAPASLTRTYRFITLGEPFALVTEWFPLDE